MRIAAVACGKRSTGTSSGTRLALSLALEASDASSSASSSALVSYMTLAHGFVKHRHTALD